MPLFDRKSSEKRASEEDEREKVDVIVKRIQKKEEKQGIIEGRIAGGLGRLQESIAGDKKVRIQSIGELQTFDSKSIAQIGSIYTNFESLFKPFFNLLVILSLNSKLYYYLNSANMRFSAFQWIAITTVVSLLIAVASFFVTLIVMAVTGFNPMFLLMPVAVFLIVSAIMFSLPKRNAIKRSLDYEAHLPFALRHLGILIKSGLGLYSGIKAIAFSDYDTLSEEFQRVVIEIEEGIETKTALYNLALRTQSKPLRNALMHMIRALKTGGNLSDLLAKIADDVAFEQLDRMKAFTQKLNFLGVIFIFAAIVMPVLFSILGGIKNAPIQSDMLKGLPLTTEVLILFYLIGMPSILLLLFLYIKSIQPRM